MDWIEFLLNVVLLIIEGFILAILLNYWQEWVGKRKDKRELGFIFSHIYKYLQKMEIQELYYYIKLASERDKALVQQILKMELIIETQTGSFGNKEDDLLLLKNNEYGLFLDNQWKSYIVSFKIKEDDDASTPQKFYFGEPPQNMKSFAQPFQNFLKYFEERCKMYDIKI